MVYTFISLYFTGLIPIFCGIRFKCLSFSEFNGGIYFRLNIRGRRKTKLKFD